MYVSENLFLRQKFWKIFHKQFSLFFSGKDVEPFSVKIFPWKKKISSMPGHKKVKFLPLILAAAGADRA